MNKRGLPSLVFSQAINLKKIALERLIRRHITRFSRLTLSNGYNDSDSLSRV